jgi:hypothetical protein
MLHMAGIRAFMGYAAPIQPFCRVAEGVAA